MLALRRNDSIAINNARKASISDPGQDVSRRNNCEPGARNRGNEALTGRQLACQRVGISLFALFMVYVNVTSAKLGDENALAASQFIFSMPRMLPITQALIPPGAFQVNLRHPDGTAGRHRLSRLFLPVELIFQVVNAEVSAVFSLFGSNGLET